MARPDRPTPYPEVPQQPDLPAIELAVIDRWRDEGTFQASIDARPAGDGGGNEYVFYDGPPFANGLPHYGHLLTGYVKDAVPRYQTMRGRRVERRFGWDTHGLPAEIEAEKELGISGHQAIADYGIEKFNGVCRRSVLRYTEAWERYVNRQARWVDFANDYKTLDLPYMESVMWAFKQLYEKGLVYEGHKVLAYCWECETPLSTTETRMDDAYKNRVDPAVTVTFELETGERILVWTTTPWTLPSNLAIAVGPGIDYAVVEEDGVRYVLGEAALAKYEQQLGAATRVDTLQGFELVGRRYRPLFPYFADTDNAFVVLGGDFVSTDEGTGVVHMAPGFGEDDQRACEAAGIPVVCPVDDRGRFTSEVADFEGQQVFDANRSIIAALKERGMLVRHDSYDHSYPHCWRSGTPLIYRAVDSWFVRVSAIKDRMLELNQQIRWVPEHVRDGSFGQGLASAPDWSISRNRFWGAPIPVWKSDDPEHPRVDVYGSLDEIEADFGVRPTDLHRPAIDELTRPNPDDPTGASTMRRVDTVLDCWFESGSMPFAQVHYPFENREWFDDHYPGDFIVEYIGQTRGWFYTLHVLATALFDRPAFRTCVAHGIVLGDDGQKMSKSVRNYPDVYEMFDTYGSDALRWMLLSSAVLRGSDLIVDERSIREAWRDVIAPLWNSWYFFALYANTEGHRAAWRTDSTDVLDRYVLAKLRTLVEDVTERFDAYDFFGACASVRSFLDALTNWYVRRSRGRVQDGDAEALDTLFTVLEVLCRVVAPVLPMVADEIHRGLTGGDSVHLADWPDAAGLPADEALVRGMDLARDVCSAGSSIRKAQTPVLRVRLPLPSLTVAGPAAASLAPYADLVADEVNVKQVVLRDDVGSLGEEQIVVTPSVVGPKLGSATQQVILAVKRGDYVLDPNAGTLTVAGHVLDPGDFVRRLQPSDESTTRALAGDAGLVQLDTSVSPELEAEGTARDVARLVNAARKDASLHVSDRIHLVLHLPDDVRAAVDTHRAWVQREVLAVDVVLADDEPAQARRAELPDGRAVRIGVQRVGR